MGYTKATKHFLPIGFAATNPLDSTFYAFLRPDAALSGAVDKNTMYYTPQALLLTRFNIWLMSDVAYSAEAHSLNVYSSTTVTVPIALSKPAVNKAYASQDINLLIPAGGYFSFNTTTPAWVTNPTGLVGYGSIEYIIL